MSIQSPSERWSDFFLPKEEAISAEELKKCRLLTFVCFLTSALALAYFGFSLAVGFEMGVYAMAISAVVTAALPFAVRAGASRVVIANVYVAIIFLNTVVITSQSGGLSASITSPYIALVPMLGVMLINQRAGLIWFMVVVVEILVLGLSQMAGVEFPVSFSAEVDTAFKLAALLGLVAIIFFIVRDFDGRAEAALQQVEEEQERTQALLLNILPEDVAEELKSTGRAQAHEFEQVTILLCDFQDFTELSADMTPSDLVTELNTCFYAFDAITRQFGLEKIKTIGDAYMAASGLGVDGVSSPVDVIRAALAMHEFLARHGEENRAAGKTAFMMRTGIHTGPVVAGVVGDTKFQYDVWGDTVNTAARMEAAGEAGEINISGTTHSLVQEEESLMFTARGRLTVKGKGELEMFFVKENLNRSMSSSSKPMSTVESD